MDVFQQYKGISLSQINFDFNLENAVESDTKTGTEIVFSKQNSSIVSQDETLNDQRLLQRTHIEEKGMIYKMLV
ncbi:hypothetical protein NQ314_008961 [Rhamnusium bicolor]|uniref:Uncharacterized protein n=1 Tax=Rhamnusium bicolor TaxID=1586634 RepID=A0AAV8Y5R0_9CUCU|nr:hypothetical protein NQ314_008961 [Rhamnusium bicolor]